MSSRVEARKHETVAGIISAGQHLFFNSPDIANVFLQANTPADSFITFVTGSYLNAPIMGVPNINRYFNAATTITNLESSRYSLKQPITLGIEQVGDDEWLATFAEADLSRSGDTPHDAVDWLRSSIVQLFQVFKTEKALGPLPKRQLEVLGRYIVEKPNRPK
jgi:hypothetical protein